ncbi:CGNR zinc finger domain-containing protein [Actinospica sp.]|uniref:CGNR zinc finger domain-containing protein n=1 Tax=Actinospica sp. TaxID=1872142 RepID=UPI002D7F6F7F|nr:CGNR zinc finger domain-containing protein [Actinospica sp.]
MLFASHVEVLLEAAVNLVNELTDGERRGTPYSAPRGAHLPMAAAAALPRRPGVEPPPAELPADGAARLARAAREMRGVFEAVAEGRVDDAARIVNALLLETGARPQLDRTPGEPWQVHFHGADDRYGAGWSAGCATALALAVGGEVGTRIGVCRAPHCDRVYVDGSRNSARRFCSASCQSRVKAAAFRARRAGVPDPESAS